ncbi:MAG TPA: hypothetical protein VG871_20190 [Vicinamibacterales bacterium]|nr:hypothetical protein [Vicinamibacterales bacterium]HVZ23408.1 hypothetical protein [Vicinamibacterales bacterium]
MRITTLMMKSLIGSALILTLALAAPAAAQQPSRPVSGGNDQTMLVGAGLTFLNAGDSTGVGFAGNALFNALKTTDTGRIGIVGDLGWNHFDGGSATTVMGGGRYTFTTKGKVVPYGQFLVGVVHSPGSTDFHPSLGFGADVAWLPNLNFRGEISFIFADSNATRFFLGVSLPIHKR